MSAHGATLVRVTRVLFRLSGALWAGVGLLMLSGAFSAGLGDAGTARVVGVLMVAVGAFVGVLAVRVLRGHRLTDLAALLALVGSIVVSILDEPGAYDLAFIALTLVVLAVFVAALSRERRRRRGA